LAFYFLYYNFVRIHKSLKTSPAMAAGVTDKLFEIEDIAALLGARDVRRARSEPSVNPQDGLPASLSGMGSSSSQ
jgi:hypothetical protein